MEAAILCSDGAEILTVLFTRYPVIATDEKVELDSDQEYNERVAEVASPTIIDLDEWIISPTQPESLCELGNSEGQPESSETAPPFALTPPAVLFTNSTPSNTTSETQLTFTFEY